MTVLCLGKFLFWPFWPFLGQKYIACGDIIWFLAENGLLSLYLRNRASDFDDFSQMLDIIALNDSASVLCARKFSFATPGGIYPPKISLLAKMA